MPNNIPEILKRRQAVIDKLNPNKLVYYHDFQPKSGKCTKCRATIVSEGVEQADGTYRIKMFCPVIGREEFNQFRSDEL